MRIAGANHQELFFLVSILLFPPILGSFFLDDREAPSWRGGLSGRRRVTVGVIESAMGKLRHFSRLAILASGLVLAVASSAIGQSKHMLFRVRGATGTALYLLGSVHLLTPEAGKLPAAVDSAFANAKIVGFETSIDSLQQRAAELLAKARYANGATLRSSLSPEHVTAIDSIMHLYGLSIAQLNAYKPWFVGLAMSQLVMQRAGFQPQYGVDVQLNQRARDAGKTILGLESVDFQLNLFDSMTPADQELMLLKDKGPAEDAKALELMKSAWLAGDPARLDSLVRTSDAFSPTLQAALVTNRNRSWIPQLEALLGGKDDALVVVGAAHLVGDQGVLALLRAKGYKIEQL